MSEASQTKLEQIKRNEFIKASIDYVGAGVVITDPSKEDNPIIYVNRGFEEMTGYQAQEVLGRNCRFLQGEETESAAVTTLRNALEKQEQVNVELKNYRKDGSSFWNELQIYPVYMETMEQTYFVGVQRDVSKRKRTRKWSIITLAKSIDCPLRSYQ
ncbi:PAS domain-containing protein [Thalassobacillus sp. CUG 92003]|uniref:PAS domain-containing protein n=1 Tax=Thalassobacillus sp. CUG 92003 TaxID=2736641 RepID=UPI0021059BF6|nr:PAS domain-containing protein [Thalassobacillus sp. CUG 92003]